MYLLLIIISIILGVIIFLGILTYCFIQYFKRTLNISTSELKELINESEESKYRQKSISGMSEILVPKILRDYSSFNEQSLYSKVELALRNIFKSLETKKIVNIPELNIIRDTLEAEISDLESINKKVKYDDIVFHRHAIRDYSNRDGFLCITVETSLEYYYQEIINEEVITKKDNHKKQNVYTTKFIHIYDPELFEASKQYLSAHCPNCGAPLKNYQDNHCNYCNSGVDPIDLKSWYISSYKSKY